MEMRLTVTEQVSRNAGFVGRPLAVQVIDPTTGYIVKAAKLFATPPELRELIPPANIEVRTPLGLFMHPSVIKAEPDEIDAKATKIDALFEVANRWKLPQDVPEMLYYPSLPFFVAKSIITVQQILQVVNAGYEICGDRASELKNLIRTNSLDVGIGMLSLVDGRRVAQELNRQHPGRNFRIPTEAEFMQLKLRPIVRAKIAHKNFLFWTETKERNTGDSFYVLRNMLDDERTSLSPTSRLGNYQAILLIEDKLSSKLPAGVVYQEEG